MCAALFSVAALLVGVRELGALVPLTARALDRALCVVVPARNEPDIGACLAGVLADPHRELRVIVVDDRSTDDTAARVERVAAADPRVRLVRVADDPPPGVFGKPRALALGLEAAGRSATRDEDDLVLFLDADVGLAPGALGALVHARAETGARALSGVPALELRTRGEQLFVPVLASVVTARFLPSRVHDERAPVAFLNGQLILVDRAALASVGGWAGVSDTVLEDVALATKLKASGARLRLADVRALASTRMYASFGEIVEGFGKNATALLGVSAGVIGWCSFALACFPWIALALAAPAAVVGDVLGAIACGLALAPIAVALRARAMAGQPRWPALVLPIAYAGAALVLARASWRHLRRRGVTWKGRTYPRSG